MFSILFHTELKRNFRHPLFLLMGGIILCTFLCGTLSFHTQWQHRMKEFTQWEQAHEKDSFTYHLTSKALNWDEYRFAPQISEIIDPCNRGDLPQSITASAFRVVGYNISLISNNPLIEKSQPISWTFIVSFLLSFMALMLSYNAVSGSKNPNTLSLLFSYPISRAGFLMSKFLSVWLLCGGILLSGIIISTTCLWIAGDGISSVFLLEAGIFFIYSLIFLALFIAFGLLSSIVTMHSGSSLLVSVSFWLLCFVILPNTHQFIARHLYPFPETRDDMEKRFEREQYQMVLDAPAGSLTSDVKPDFPNHKLRAELFTRMNEVYKQLVDEYAEGTFQQYEQTLSTLKLSPYNLYQQMNEHWLNGGYVRFKKNWEAMKVFQKEYEEWFKAEDAKDPESPHWYNPMGDLSTSQKLIAGSEFPDYAEPDITFSEKIQFVWKYALIILGMSFFLLIISIFAFNKYDVR